MRRTDSVKESKKWKPKHKWTESIIINLKTGKKKYKYLIPKTPEEEKRLEDEFNERMKRAFDLIFSKGILKK